MRWWPTIFLLLFGLLVPTNRAATNDSFAAGLELIRAGNFPAATSVYQTAFPAEISVGALLNLGFSEWQRGHAGPAIRAWEQAQWVDALDERAAMNLKFARQVTQLEAPELKWFEQASTWLPVNWWVWIAGGSLWLAVGVTVLPSIFRRRKAGWHATLAAVGWMIFLFSLTANYGVVSRTHLGIVLPKNASLQLTPTSESEVITTLTSGESARQLRERGNYLLIRTSNATGWILREQFGRINPP
jgi:hypothetical protein